MGNTFFTNDLVRWIKRYYLWCALIVSVLLSWHASQDEAPDLVPASNIKTDRNIVKNVHETATSMQLSNNANQWPNRGGETISVVDIFNPITVDTHVKNDTLTNGKPETPLPLPVEQTFSFRFFGKIDNDGNDILFLQDENLNVISARVGQHINSKWQLINLDAEKAIFKHNESGKLFQIVIRNSE